MKLQFLICALTILISLSAQAQTCESIFSEQIPTLELTSHDYESLSALAQRQVEITYNPDISKIHKTEILLQLQTQLHEFAENMNFSSAETIAFKKEYRSLVYKAQEGPTFSSNRVSKLEVYRQLINYIKLLPKKYNNLIKIPENESDNLIIDSTYHEVLATIAKLKTLTPEHIEDFKKLLQFGANPEFQGSFESPFLISVQNNHIKLVELILEYKINIDVQSIYMQDFANTALMFASENGYFDIVKLLIINDANINKQGKYGQTALHLAVQNRHIDIAKLLIENNADVNLQKNFDEAALHLAAFYNQLEIVKMLVEKGADIEARTKDNRTALQLARQRGNKEISNYLATHRKTSTLSRRIRSSINDFKSFFISTKE